MRFHAKKLFVNPLLTLLLLGWSLVGIAQGQRLTQGGDQNRPSGPQVNSAAYGGPRVAGPGQYVNLAPNLVAERMLLDNARSDNAASNAYFDLAWRERARAAKNGEDPDSEFLWYGGQQRQEPDPQAKPDSPDQSDLLKNSHDREFILRNFRTMYVDARDAKYFGSSQMKAALGKNKDFEKLGFRIVDDRRVADVVLKVSYTFAWDYPFELMHQNSTMVLLSGKGEGPFSGPLGAADVARVLVNATRPWRTEKKAEGKTEAAKN